MKVTDIFSIKPHSRQMNDEIEAAFIKAGAPIFWRGRCQEAVCDICSGGNQGQRLPSNFTNVKVTSKDFPLEGHFEFVHCVTGKVFKLRLIGNKWICKAD